MLDEVAQGWSKRVLSFSKDRDFTASEHLLSCLTTFTGKIFFLISNSPACCNFCLPHASEVPASVFSTNHPTTPGCFRYVNTDGVVKENFDFSFLYSFFCP